MSKLKDGAYLYCRCEKLSKKDDGFKIITPYRYRLTVPFPQYPCDLNNKPIVQAAVEYFECVSRLYDLCYHITYSTLHAIPLRDWVHGHKLPENCCASTGLAQWADRMHTHATGYGIRQFPTEFKHYFKMPGLHGIMWTLAPKFCYDSQADWEPYYAAHKLAHPEDWKEDPPFEYDFCNPIGMQFAFDHALAPEGSVKERKKKEEEYVPTYDI